MKLYYFLVIKGDAEQASATLDMRRKDLPEFGTEGMGPEALEAVEYGYCQTQMEVAFEVETEPDVRHLEGVLNAWLCEDAEAPYPLGSLLFWHANPDVGGTQEYAKARGIKVFDTALPQQWCDNVRAMLGDPHLWLMGNIVWSYDPASVWGAPAAVTKMGDEILARLGESAYRIG